eukprot:COSAG01_NODE_429_length_17183_cov_22.990869_18_plen_170_part_00
MLSRSELQCKLSDFGLTDADIEQLFCRLDTDGDGSIDLDEWIAGYSVYCGLVSGGAGVTPILSPSSSILKKTKPARSDQKAAILKSAKPALVAEAGKRPNKKGSSSSSSAWTTKKPPTGGRKKKAPGAAAKPKKKGAKVKGGGTASSSRKKPAKVALRRAAAPEIFMSL